MTSLLIDIDKMKLLKVVEGEDEVLRLEYWADILIPKSEFYVCGDAKRDLSQFTQMELQMLYNNSINADLRMRDYPHALEMVSFMRDNFKRDDKSLTKLIKKLGKHRKAQTAVPVKEKPEAKSKLSSSTPTRPKEGTMTVRVWEASDYFYKMPQWGEINSKEFRDYVIQVCVDGGLNRSTASTQFAKWKKFTLAQ